MERTRKENAEQTLHTAVTLATLSLLSPPLPPPPALDARRRARHPYHNTRRKSSKNPGKTKSSLAMAQRRPKSTIPGIAKARRPGSGRPAARRSPLGVPRPPGATTHLTATPRRLTRGRSPAHALADAEPGARCPTLCACADARTRTTLADCIAGGRENEIHSASISML